MRRLLRELQISLPDNITKARRWDGWAEKDSNLRRAKPDWFTASSDWPLRHLPMEPTVRFELTTGCLQNSCSTPELRRRAVSLQ